MTGSPIDGAPRRILVIDDNADAAESLAMLLTLAGHQTETARDCATALLVAQTFGPELVFMDIGLPGMDGYQVAGKLRSEGGLATARFIALTGHGSANDKLRSRQEGFVVHLQKPLDPRKLPEIVAAALAPPAC